MPAEHFVPRFAKEISASPRVQANALKALALANPTAPEEEWRGVAAAALIVGAQWEGQKLAKDEVARAAGVPEAMVAQHYQKLADTLRKALR
ncbi:MAG TPA: hypothetical protein VFH78_00935 [Candidatus Thermoplasmatota archaeon]|nr:hypothetical protein [Candidatus Thermoplasmatota archaeon]